MKARKVIIIRPSLFVRTIISAARIDLLDDTNKIPYSGGKIQLALCLKAPSFSL